MDFNEKFADFSLDCRNMAEYLKEADRGALFCVATIGTDGEDELTNSTVLSGYEENMIYALFTSAVEHDTVKELILLTAEMIKEYENQPEQIEL